MCVWGGSDYLTGGALWALQRNRVGASQYKSSLPEDGEWTSPRLALLMWPLMSPSSMWEAEVFRCPSSRPGKAAQGCSQASCPSWQGLGLGWTWHWQLLSGGLPGQSPFSCLLSPDLQWPSLCRTLWRCGFPDSTGTQHSALALSTVRQFLAPGWGLLLHWILVQAHKKLLRKVHC